MILRFLIAVSVFLFGLCIGSFLNCVVYRLEKKESFVGGRSYCPKCKNNLRWQDLFPVISFFILNGKCRYCGDKISWQYPLVEISTALVFLSIFNFHFLDYSQIAKILHLNFLSLVFSWYIAASLIIILIYDFKHYLIPDKVLLPAIAVSFIYQLSFGDIINNFLAILISTGFLGMIFLISKGKWMGFGDVKLTILLSLITGFPNIIIALFLSFFLGAGMGIILMILGLKKLKGEIPFGPFLIIGTVLAVLRGSEIIKWYFDFSKLNLF